MGNQNERFIEFKEKISDLVTLYGLKAEKGKMEETVNETLTVLTDAIGLVVASLFGAFNLYQNPELLNKIKEELVENIKNAVLESINRLEKHVTEARLVIDKMLNDSGNPEKIINDAIENLEEKQKEEIKLFFVPTKNTPS